MTPPGQYNIKGLVSSLRVTTPPRDEISEETCERVVRALEEQGKLPWRTMAVSANRQELSLEPAEWEMLLDGETFFCWQLRDFMVISRQPLGMVLEGRGE